MALTIAIEGLGVIANADAETNDTGGTGTGDWGFTGSGGVANGLTTDTYYYGSASIAAALSGVKNGWLWFDRGAGNELDFDTAGSEEGEHIYIWVACPTIGLLETIANEGLTIRIGGSTSDYRDFTIAGSDGANGWDGSFRCFVIDPTKAGSNDGGTYDAGDIRYIGARMATTATAKGDNLFISQIAVGSGLRVTGTSTTGWLDVVNYCTDLANRAWGMFQEREGVYYAYGVTYIGDAASQTAVVSFTDSGRVIQYGISEYHNGTSWVTSADIDYQGLVIEDHSSYTTTFSDGIAVGSDQGRSGSTFIGNGNHDVAVDLYGGNNAGSLTTLYGTTFKGLTGSLVSGNDAQHKIYSCSFIACGQFSPAGAVEIVNCLFSETADADAALLWDENIDISDCTFIANTLGAAIEHGGSTGSPYDYYDLVFSGNTYDGLNTSGSNITVNNNGSSDAANDEGANTITYLSSATLTMVVKDTSGSVISGAYAYIDDNNITPFIMNTTTNASGIASVGHTAGYVASSTWRIRKYGFKQFLLVTDIPASGLKSIPVTLVTDPQQT